VRLATIVGSTGHVAAVVRGDRCLPLHAGLTSVRTIAHAGAEGLEQVTAYADAASPDAWVPRAGLTLGPVVPDPGAIYTIGLNYDGPGAAPRPDRPLVFGKAASSVAAHGATLAWDRAVSDNVDAEVELGVVVGSGGRVFGYTIIDDVSSRDAWLDGDQWLLGKSMPGFCPAGPSLVPVGDLDPADLRLACTINDDPIQDGRTADMRFSIAEIVSFLSRHLELRPGDLIATGTPVRLATPPGPDRHLEPGDVVVCRIEGIGELTTRIV